MIGSKVRSKNKPYRETAKFANRLAVSMTIKAKYVDRVPVILEQRDGCTLSSIERTKYIVPKNTTMARFAFEVRQYISLRSTDALFLFIRHYRKPETIPDLQDSISFSTSEDAALAGSTIEVSKDTEIIAPPFATVGDIYAKYADIDGFLYVNYSGESTFG